MIIIYERSHNLSQQDKPLQSPRSELQEHTVCFKSATSDMKRWGGGLFKGLELLAEGGGGQS